MNKIFKKILWEKGVILRQRVQMPSIENLHENLRIRPFTTSIVQKLHSDDYPLQEFRDLAEYNFWIESNLAGNLGDGIFYVQCYGRHFQKWYGKRRATNFKKGTKGLKIRKYYGWIALDKFEIKGGVVVRHFHKRGYRKIAPRNKKPTYPIHSLFNVT